MAEIEKNELRISDTYCTPYIHYNREVYGSISTILCVYA